MADRDSLLPSRDEPIFPIADRNTPVLDKINERREGEGSLASKVGERAGEIINTDEDERAKVLMESRVDFRESLANSLGVPEGALDDDVVEEMTSVFGGYSESDVVDNSILQVKETVDSEKTDSPEEE